MHIRRFTTNPVIRPHLDDRMGDNVNGPSLIRVPDWIEEPLGRYYLYFAHHDGQYIRLAYSNELHGPWTTPYGQGIQSAGQKPARGLPIAPRSEILPLGWVSYARGETGRGDGLEEAVGLHHRVGG
jgi:hypothetical protein